MYDLTDLIVFAVIGLVVGALAATAVALELADRRAHELGYLRALARSRGAVSDPETRSGWTLGDTWPDGPGSDDDDDSDDDGPDFDYVPGELPEVDPDDAPPRPGAALLPDGWETPMERVDRLERELTIAWGDVALLTAADERAVQQLLDSGALAIPDWIPGYGLPAV